VTRKRCEGASRSDALRKAGGNPGTRGRDGTAWHSREGGVIVPLPVHPG
jgi:hypothetical protein